MEQDRNRNIGCTFLSSLTVRFLLDVFLSGEMSCYQGEQLTNLQAESVRKEMKQIMA